MLDALARLGGLADDLAAEAVVRFGFLRVAGAWRFARVGGALASAAGASPATDAVAVEGATSSCAATSAATEGGTVAGDAADRLALRRTFEVCLFARARRRPGSDEAAPSSAAACAGAAACVASVPCVVSPV